MRKFSNIISLAACFVLLWGCDEYDDGELRQNIDAIEQELTETEKRVERLNEEMNSLSALINSSFISYLKQDDEGNYVISYRDHGGETKTVTLATQDDVVTAPIVGAGEFTDGKLYWRTTADNGKTYQWLLDKEGNGVYSCRMMLEPGTYEYKFVVDVEWKLDSNNPNFAPNDLGTLNSVLVVESK